MIDKGVKIRAIAPEDEEKAPCRLPNQSVNVMREFARRLTRGLHRISESLERDIEMILRENPRFNPEKVAKFVTLALIEWEMMA